MVAPGPYYAGQGIPIEVVTVAGGERPEVDVPRVPGAEVIATGTRFRPISTSAIGNVVNETNRYTFTFEVLPERAGTLTVPSFRVSDGERSGRTAPLRLDVRPLPVVGRPASFLGGVGPLEVSAVARPSRVRVGQTFDYRIILRGPGARGSTQAPDLSRFDALPIAPGSSRPPPRRSPNRRRGSSRTASGR